MTSIELTKNLETSKDDLYNTLTNDLLLKVNKPGQYLGIEWGHLISSKKNDSTLLSGSNKTWESTSTRCSIIYPDLYELGLANFGIKILYKIINSYKEFLCDRTYAPMNDMEELIRKNNTPLWGWETHKPLKEFDILGFSLSYELSYTNVLNLLELSKLELYSKNRKEIFPLIFAGGPCTFNSEPMADFIDFFIIGDGEEVIPEAMALIEDFKKTNDITNTELKENLLLSLANIPGIYVPRFYSPNELKNYLPEPIEGFKVPKTITKRVVSLSDSNHPSGELVPNLSTVHDRQVLEIRRGCDRGCRFCQPGYVYLPVRERTPDNLLKISKIALDSTGYDEYSLLSLSASDYTRLHELAHKLNKEHSRKAISMSMPSQRADRFDTTIADEINTVRNTGITLAPEAGTERLRNVINKGLKEDDIKRAIKNVYDGGFKSVKLYFMIGLPTETYEDLDGIISLLEWMKGLSREKNKKPLNITCTISTFVPKPFTPFQWFGQNSITEFKEKINYLHKKIKESNLRNVKLNCTDPQIALLEDILSRGDRRIGNVIYRAFKKGAKFDAWGECLNITNWIEAGKEENLNLEEMASAERSIGSNTPWEVIDSGLLKKFLIEEAYKAYQASETSACTENSCHACGICFDLNVVNEVSTNLSKNNKFVVEIDKNKEEIDITKLSTNITVNDIKTTKPNQIHANVPTVSKSKFEIIHTKIGNFKFISHLDLQRLFERAMRRAKLSICFTEGYNPRPKFQWLMPLPIYYESEYEVLSLELSEEICPKELKNRLNSQLPAEIQVKNVKQVDVKYKLANIENIKLSYRILTCKPILWEKYECELNKAVENFLAKSSHFIKIFKKSKEKSYPDEKIFKEIDVRSHVEDIKILANNPLSLEIKVIGNTRPELVLNEISPSEFYINPENLPFNWQTSWIIKKLNAK